MLKSLDYLLGVLDSIASIAEMFPGVTVPAALADKLIKVAQAAVQAHNSATGQTLDLSLLQPIQPTPVPGTQTTTTTVVVTPGMGTSLPPVA